MNYILTKCATDTTGAKTRIDYPTVRGAVVSGANDDLQLLCWATADLMDRVLRRQAVLEALHTEGRSADILNHFAADGPGFLASINTPIRSSHAGAPVDPLLPQGPYLAAPANAVGVRGQANWAWLHDSTTRHTTHHPPVNVNRVASYFELHVPDIVDNSGTLQLGGGRIVYDPFNHRFFISEHYAAEFELVNVPAVTADAAYLPTRQEIQAHAAALALGGPAWTALYDDLAARMSAGTL